MFGLERCDLIAIAMGIGGILIGLLIAYLIYKKSSDDLEKKHQEVIKNLTTMPGQAAELMRFRNGLDVAVAAGAAFGPELASGLKAVIDFFTPHLKADANTAASPAPENGPSEKPRKGEDGRESTKPAT